MTIQEHVLPTITDMAKSFFRSAAQFAAAGLPRTPLEQLQGRLDKCKACKYWNPDGFGGTGACRQCGCSTQAKLRMATSECPMGYWQAATKATVRRPASGFSPTPPDILATRESTCRACPEWDATALNNTGRCRKCGCSTWAKLRMATERCPLGKW